jgi:hypothetical protein
LGLSTRNEQAFQIEEPVHHVFHAQAHQLVLVGAQQQGTRCIIFWSGAGGGGKGCVKQMVLRGRGKAGAHEEQGPRSGQQLPLFQCRFVAFVIHACAFWPVWVCIAAQGK